MLGLIILWLLLGVGASVLVTMVHTQSYRVSFERRQAIISVCGALIGGIILLIAAPGAPGWALVTALMGSIIALTGEQISRWVREQAHS